MSQSIPPCGACDSVYCEQCFHCHDCGEKDCGYPHECNETKNVSFSQEVCDEGGCLGKYLKDRKCPNCHSKNCGGQCSHCHGCGKQDCGNTCECKEKKDIIFRPLICKSSTCLNLK